MTVGRAREAIGGPRRQREGPRREAGLFASRSSIIQSCKQLPPGPAHHRIEITAAASRPDEPLAAIEQDIRAR
jgi:hypothetical protein